MKIQLTRQETDMLKQRYNLTNKDIANIKDDIAFGVFNDVARQYAIEHGRIRS